MSATPSDGRRGSADSRPIIRKAQGHVPACLVNASVTYCDNDQIYAFGGFDQYTDEGPWMIPPLVGVTQEQFCANIFANQFTTMS